jgi:hypothetical protein
MPAVHLAVEGDLDAAVYRRIVSDCSGSVGLEHGRQGRSYILQNIARWVSIARTYATVVTWDADGNCVRQEVQRLRQQGGLPLPKSMVLSVAVNAVEAWLLADRAGIQRFLGVRLAQVPRLPERTRDPKQAMLALVRKSRRKALVRDMAGAAGQGQGPLYTARLVEFALRTWNLDEAAVLSASLARARDRIRALLSQTRHQ